AYVVAANPNNYLGSGGTNQHVWRTIDGGANWMNLSGTSGSGGLPDLPTWTIEMDPRGAGSSDDVLYVGTDAGVYTLTDPTPATPTWSKLGTGLPNVQVVDLRLDAARKRLVAGTHGRGAWEVYLG